MNMKNLAALLLLAAGCQSGDGNKPPPDDRTTDPTVEILGKSQIPYEVDFLKVGQWVLYSAKIEGESRAWSVKFACVAADEAGVWIENKLPTAGIPMVVKVKKARDGSLLEQWVGEPGSPSPAKTFPREGHKTKTDTGPQPTVKTVETTETLIVGGRTYACTRVTSTFTHSGGRTTTVIDWYTPEVVFGTRKYGGVVKRQFGRFSMELAASGTTAQVELKIPK